MGLIFLKSQRPYACFLVIGLLSILAGCSASEPRGIPAAPAAPPVASAAQKTQYGNPQSAATPRPSVASRKLIKNAKLSLSVTHVAQTAEKIQRSSEDLGGFVFSSDFSASASEPESSAQVVLKIPAERLESFLKELAVLGKMTSKSETGEDVTDEYVDQESRLRNLRREQDRLREMMGTAGKLTELLEVEREITRVEGETDQIEGHLKHIDNQVAYSTVSVSLYSSTLPQMSEDFWDLSATAADACSLFRSIVRFGIRTLIYALVFVPFILPLWLVFRYRRRDKTKPDVDPQTA